MFGYESIKVCLIDLGGGGQVAKFYIVLLTENKEESTPFGRSGFLSFISEYIHVFVHACPWRPDKVVRHAGASVNRQL